MRLENVVPLLQNVAFFALPIVIYLLLVRGRDGAYSEQSGPYTRPGWNFFLKRGWARLALWRRRGRRRRGDWKDNLLPKKEEALLERSKRDLGGDEGTADALWLWGADAAGSRLLLHMRLLSARKAEVAIFLWLQDGTCYTLPGHPHSSVRREGGVEAWAAGGLRLDVSLPLRVWRVRYSGLLRRWEGGPGVGAGGADAVPGDVGHMEPVDFTFLWRAASDPFSLQEDWHPGLKAEALAREPWRDGRWVELTSDLGDGFDQWGTLRGRVRRAAAGELELHLWGLRRRRWGPRDEAWRRRGLRLSASAASGLRFALEAHSGASTSQAVWGHVQELDNMQHPVDWTDLSLPAFAEHRDCVPRHLVLRFSAGGRNYAADVVVKKESGAVVRAGHPWSSETLVLPFQCTVNNSQAEGVIELWYRYEGECPVPVGEEVPDLLQEALRPMPTPAPLVAQLDDAAARCAALTGGKGSSLALMVALQDPEMLVPEGFCVTMAALERQLEATPTLRAALEALSAAAALGNADRLRDACDKAQEAFAGAAVTPEVAAAVAAALETLGPETPAVAVRSSAVGEDAEGQSAAGQNATLLGVATRADAVLDALRRCWASLFAFASVEYRRRRGQPTAVGAKMAVVVQRMAAARAAGVLFTRDPAPADPAASSRLIITANYGLGESVVSAQIEPDTVVLARDWHDNISIADTICGRKSHKVEMSEDGDGVRSVDLAEGEATQLCITPAEILRLGRLGVKLEAAFGGPRDIEWAIVEERLYLLQSRPITSLDAWSEYELLHELDGPVQSDTEVLTLGNTGEVFPGITSPLTQSFLAPVLDGCIMDSLGLNGFLCFPHSLNTTHHQVLLNIHNMMYRELEEKISTPFRVAEIAVLGHIVTTPELHRYGLNRYGAMTGKRRIKTLKKSLIATWWNDSNTKKAEKIAKSIHINECNYTTSAILYLAISNNLKKLAEVARCHSWTSRVSVFSQVIAMSILTEGKDELTPDHFNDFSLLLSSCSDVVSADVPADLNSLAQSIMASGRGEEFCSLPPELAVEWLEANPGEISQKFNAFISKHGHRCIKEFDVMTETWSMKPDSIISTVQAVVKSAKSNQEPKQPMTPEETVARFKSVQNNRTRSTISLLLPWCRKTVVRRETSKNAFITTIHHFRVAFRRLAQLMQQEGRLPEEDLIFFMTFYELGDFLETRNPAILAKAVMRRRFWPEWEKIKLPEMVIGVPKPIEVAPALSTSTSGIKLRGTPVWSGTTLGRACVVLNLGEVSQLQKGDILITRSTDIGWSPYFPLLGGVVTELGGLISHGAVVAREYGLPCIVGAQGATDMFKTGDTVLLVGSTGILEKVDS